MASNPYREGLKGQSGYAKEGRSGNYSYGDVTGQSEPVNMYLGYGADDEDMRRGYLDPGVSEGPQYDLQNYKARLSEEPTDSGNAPFLDWMPDDQKFAYKQRQRTGFLKRAYPPYERN
jgi:hypothetical protein